MYCGCKMNWAEASHVATLWFKKTHIVLQCGTVQEMNVDILQNLIAKMYQPVPCGSVLELQKLSVQQ